MIKSIPQQRKVFAFTFCLSVLCLQQILILSTTNIDLCMCECVVESKVSYILGKCPAAEMISNLKNIWDDYFLVESIVERFPMLNNLVLWMLFLPSLSYI